MLADVGFHDKTIVTEDSRICLQGLVTSDGDYEVVPLFTTLSMDTVYIAKLWPSLRNQYKQMRRWAWGVEHFPWMWERSFFATPQSQDVTACPFASFLESIRGHVFMGDCATTHFDCWSLAIVGS